MNKLTPKAYLARPYSRCFVPLDYGGYFGYIREFPGCLTEAETLEDAYRALDDAAAEWIAAALDLGQEIPEPVERKWEK